MHTISDSVERKFVDSIKVSDFEIESENGWVDITHINVTTEYDVYQLITTNSVIECADNHIVFDKNHNEIFIKDLKIGDKIIGQYGDEYVISVIKTDRKEHMIDITVKGNHTFYAHGLLHHNTSVSAAYLIWVMLFNDSKTIAILANKQATADEILSRMRLAYEELPRWMQQGVKNWNKRSIELENGSKAFSSASSSSSIRGRSISYLYLDEFAFVPNTQAEEFFTAVYPTITAGKDTKIFMTSTPNGYNHFHKFWVEAEKTQQGEKGGNGFIPLRVHWYETPGRDQKWYDEQKSILGELKTAQEIDAEFLGSGKTLLTGATLAKLTFDTPLKTFNGQEKGLLIYAYPEQDHKYTMTVDVSRGRHLDYSAFTVFDITTYPHRIVATYRNNEIPPLLYASIVHKIARNYNEAYVLIEINDVGAQIADTLWTDLEYEAMFWTKSGDLLGRTGADPYPGIRTTKKTKRIGCANLKDMIDNNQLIINDYQMIQELSTFIQKDSGSYEADEGFHDDTVTTLWLHAWMASQPWFKDLTDSDLRLRLHEDHIKSMEDELCMPVILDGNENYQDIDEHGIRHVPSLF
jgi:hypothetical protein